MKKNPFLEKLFNWEHWSSIMFYLPNLPYAIYLACKAKHLVFFTAVNPAIKSSGNGTESKFETIKLIPEKLRPKSVLIFPKTDFNTILNQLDELQIHFPVIAKPDVGFRGLLVKKIHNEKELKEYVIRYPINFIVQEFLDYKNECGVFYHRNPNQNEGKISSLTLKHFLSVVGDGNSTLKELVLADERAKLYLNLFTDIHQKKMDKIPKKGKIIQLTDVGNHSKGTQFINGNHLISKKIEQTFDKLSTAINGWYYGRVDIKYNSFEDLENGTDFKILEINGIISEPTHIYDSEKYTYFKALKTIRIHWKYLFDIAITNNNDYKIPYKSSVKFIRELVQLKKHIRNLPK